MKKIVFSLLATIAMGMSVQTASAWVKPGVLEKTLPNVYECNEGGSYCMQSVDPNDPSKNVGDRVKSNYPDKGVQEGTIYKISTSEDPSNGNESSGIQVLNEATGEVNTIITNLY